MFMEDFAQYCKKAHMMAEVHAMPKKSDASEAKPGADGGPVEKRQKPVESNAAAEKKRQEKKKALKRL